MASLAVDGDTASLPQECLLGMQQQLLDFQTDAVHAPEHNEKTACDQDSHQGDSWKESVIVDTQDGQSHEPSQASFRPPALKASKSAPSSYIAAMIPETPSQSARMAVSFHEVPGGDTQPMESQVYHEFLRNNLPASTIHANTEGSNAEGKSLNNTNLGGVDDKEHGSYVDLWTQDEGLVYDDLLAEQDSQPLSPLKQPTFPETPQLAGHKRSNDGNVVSSTAKNDETPALEGLLGTVKTPGIRPSQLFHYTQEVSSPLPGGPRSDPVLTRPSPNMLDNAVPTSYTDFSSSPMLIRENIPSSTAPEPRARYISMQESQDRRKRQFQHDLQVVPEEDSMSYDEDYTRNQQQAALRQSRKRALEGCRTFTAPSRSSPTINAKQHSSFPAPVVIHGHTVDHQVQTNVTSPYRGARESELSRYIPASNGQHDDAEDDNDDDDDDDDDEYDELTGNILGSQVNNSDHEDEAPAAGTHDDDETESSDDEQQLDDIHEQDAEVDFVPGSQHGSERTGTVFHSTQPTSLLSSQAKPQPSTRSLLNNNGPSSSVSVIPGSQYAASTSEELVKQSQLWSRPQTVPASSKEVLQPIERVPSSPPLPPYNRNIPMLDVERSHSDVESPDRHNESAGLEVPKSPSIHSSACTTQANMLRERQDMQSAIAEPGSGQAYATANTHLSPTKLRMATQDSIATPLKAAGVKRFADITNAVTQASTHQEEEIDLDDVMNNVFTEEDARYHEMMLSPTVPHPVKCRQTQRTIDSSNPAPATPVNTPPPTTAVPRAGDDAHEERPSIDDEEGAAPQTDGDAIETDDTHASLQDTPHSVRRREAAGSAAVSQFIYTTRSNMSPVHAKLSGLGKRTYGRKSRTRNVSNSDQQAREMALSTSRDDNGAQGEVHSSIPTEHAQSDIAIQPNAAPELNLNESNPELLRVTRPKRVLALFKGIPAKYYPATITHAPPDEALPHVRFDDGSASVVKSFEILPLDLRIGDIVKVDLLGMRKDWVIIGFSTTRQEDESITTDIYGHEILKLVAKTRKSIPATVSDPDAVEVNVANIYLTHTMLSSFKGRELPKAIVAARSLLRLATPVRTEPSTNTNTPHSRSERRAPRKRASMLPSSSAFSAEVAHSPHSAKKEGIFMNMAFAITLGQEDNANKASLISDITGNGGIVLEEGFDELFDIPDLLSTDAGEATSLRIKPQYQALGFVALIAHQHSRKAKYLQALALGLPTLSIRWITDTLEKCAQTSRTALPWTKYLLAAGESSYLDDAICSRALESYHPSTASFAQTFENRRLLLNNEKVLLLVQQKGRNSSVWHKRKPYAFLTLAVGAGSVRRVVDVAEAESIAVSDKSWKWIYVDKDVAETASYLSTNGTTVSRKHKRNANVATKGGSELFARVKDGNLTVISDEFVVQSLIMGALID